MVAGGRTHYQVLGVAQTATDEEIKVAWRKVALKYHPDKLISCEPEEREAGQKTFHAAKEAEACLTDKRKRRSYDQDLKRYAMHFPLNAYLAWHI